jgi:hypothetical protein
MDRYRMMIGSKPKPIAYKFPDSNSVAQVTNFILKCIKDGVHLEATNISDTILDASVVKAAKIMDCPIIVPNTVEVLRIAYGYDKIFLPTMIPAYTYRVICYGVREEDLGRKVSAVLVIKK